MTNATSNLSHVFNIREISYTGAPTPRAIFNELDSFGVYLGLERLRGERNTEYKKRLLDVFTRRASATYLGLLNGITRELGLEWYKPITVTNTNLDNSIVPGIEFKEGYVYIYRDIITSDLELTINCSDPVEPEYFLGGLVNKINSESSLFTVTLDIANKEFTRSEAIINQSSSKSILGISLNESHITSLPHTNLQKNTLVFSDRRTFLNEVSTRNLILTTGDYYVDYTNGVIQSYNVPDLGSVVRYKYDLLEFQPLATPVIIRSMISEEFQTRLFQQALSNTGDASDGIPTEFGAEVINELMSVVPMYYGV